MSKEITNLIAIPKKRCIKCKKIFFPVDIVFDKKCGGCK